MNIQERKIYSIFNRYFLILILGLGDLALFYILFTRPTVILSNFLLSLISPTVLLENSILFKETLINIIPACVAGSAYYLLTILSISIPNIKLKKRLSLIGFLFLSLFLFNSLRIFLLATISRTDLFNTVHLITWYFITTIFVVAIWFLAVRLFKIKEIPIYSDVKFLLRSIKKSKSKKTKKSKRSKKN